MFSTNMHRFGIPDPIPEQIGSKTLKTATKLGGILLNEPRYEKTDFCICKNKNADQLRGNREADQRLCFRYTDSTIPLLPKYDISSI